MITLCDMTFSDVQRHKLVHLLREVGPDAPTLCEGWTTLDLIIHLVIRENYPLAAAGMMVPQLSAKLAAQTQQLKATVPYTELVDRWERGSRLWPVAKADRWLNAVEHFVHYEDVSRAQPGKADQPQHVDRADEQALLRGLKSMSKMLLRSSTVPVVVQPDGWPRVVVHDTRGVVHNGSGVATVSGPVGEIVLWLFGRDVAQVTVDDVSAGIRRSQA